MFAHGRASECSDSAYVAEAVDTGLVTEDEMVGFAAAWLRWGDWHEAYAAVTWCRAGRMPRQPWEVGNERSRPA